MATSQQYSLPNYIGNPIPMQLNVPMNNTEVIRDYSLKFTELKKKYRWASFYYQVLFYCFFLPIVSINLGSTIIAFLASSDIYSASTIKSINIAIGIMGIVVSFLNAAKDYLKLSNKCEAFQRAESDYDVILNKLDYVKYDDTLAPTELVKILEGKEVKVRERIKYNLPYCFSNKHYKDAIKNLPMP